MHCEVNQDWKGKSGGRRMRENEARKILEIFDRERKEHMATR